MRIKLFTNQNVANGEKIFELVEETCDIRDCNVNNIIAYNDYYIPFMGMFDGTLFDCDISSIEPGMYGLEFDDTDKYSVDISGFYEMSDVWKKENWVPSIDGFGSLLSNIEKTDVSSAPNAPFISSCGTNVFEPTFYNDDNLLNKLMKTALCYKGINLDTYREKFENTSDFNNNRRHLQDVKYTSLSMSKFDKMCSIFDLDYTVTVMDKPNSKHPMNRDLSISSDGLGDGFDDLSKYLEFIRGGSLTEVDENDI
ncbi:MAG: hypothetical protein ACRC0G_07195 [Fusobacteriaceae bacterium]